MSIEIVFPWPPPQLSPNARAHWSTLAAAKKEYRAACAGYTALQLDSDARAAAEALPDRGCIPLTVEFYPPTARRMDRDNLLARIKAGLDGMCDVLDIDDARFEPITVSMKAPLGRNDPRRFSALSPIAMLVRLKIGWRAGLVKVVIS